MQHLSEEDLARLVDEGAAEGEALHLEMCEECRLGLEELSAQTRALAGLPEVAPPPAAWTALRKRLAEEELLRGVAGSPRVWTGWPMRAAAGLALFLAGTATGTLLPVRGAPTAAVIGGPAPAVETIPVEERLREAEAAYVAALTEYSEATGAGQTFDPLNQLAALEGIVLTTRAALEEAPADPVINGYHLSALGQRNAILRQIDAREDGEPWF